MSSYSNGMYADKAEDLRNSGFTVNDNWEQPIPFDTINLPEFPIDCFPSPIAAFVKALAESTQTPTEMAGILSLGVLATAFQKRYTIRVKRDYTEQLSLYVVAVAEPGERKSAVYSALNTPIYSYESQLNESEAADVERNHAEKDILDARLKALKSEMAHPKKDVNLEKLKIDIIDLTKKIADFKEIYATRLLADDVTSEKLADLMSEQNGCLTIASAEGGVFDAICGRYEKTLNIDIYLKGHAGDPLTVERISRKPNKIKNPRLSMILTVQNDVLNGFMANSTFRGRGLCGRFLYVICNSYVGDRNVNAAPIPETVTDEYNTFVERIFSDPNGGELELSDEAFQAYLGYAQYVEHRLKNDLDYMRDWGGKLCGAMCRVTALLHAADYTPANGNGNPAYIPISVDTLNRSIKIAECLSSHAMAAYQMMGADTATADAKYLLKRIESIGQDEISKRDLFDKCKGKFKKMEAMEPAVQTLVEMGYIRQDEQNTGGRPTIILRLNPLSKSSRSSKRVS